MQVWLDASLSAHAIPEDPCQLPFPPEVQAIDLGPAINDALQISLPSANLCGRPDCNIQCKQKHISTMCTGTCDTHGQFQANMAEQVRSMMPSLCA